MGDRRRKPGQVRRRYNTPGRDKLTTHVDSVLLAGMRDLAKRRRAQICEMTEQAFRRLLQDETADKTDAIMAPLIDRVIQTRLKSLEGGLRTMIARLAYENLTLQYIVLHFLVEANIPPSKVEKWRMDGRKFAIQEYRRKPDLDGPLEEDDEA